MHSISLYNITLMDGIYKNANDAVHRALLRLDPDSLLVHPRLEAAIKTDVSPLGDLPPFNFGASAGHYMSSASLMFALTGDTILRERVEYVVKALRECQEAHGDGYCGGVYCGKPGFEKLRENIVENVHFSGFNGIDSVPWYNMHKIYQGFADAYNYAKIELAKAALIDLCNWTYDVLKNLSEENVQKMVSVEFGGMQEALVDAFNIIKDDKIKVLSQIFTDRHFLDNLKINNNILPGYHANTMIPKFTGHARYHQVFNNNDYYVSSVNFWDLVVNSQTFINGGNSFDEHFLKEDQFENVIISPKGPECCNEYNMSKLTKYLFEEHSHSKFMDYFEKIILNHMLTSIDPITGGRAYFTSIAPMSYRATIDDSPTCCGFTMLEFASRAHELIYSCDDNKLYINQYIASKLKLENGVTVTQMTAFPYEEKSKLTLNMESPVDMDLYIRKPYWSKNFSIRINQQDVRYIVENGYARITETFENNDVIEIVLEMEVEFEYLPNSRKYGAFRFGPVVLAVNHGKTNFSDFQRTGQIGRGEYGNPLTWPVFQQDYENMKITRTEGLNFELHSFDKCYQLKPFFEMYDERYTIYAPLMNKFDYMIEKAKRHICKEQQPNNVVDFISYSNIQDRHNFCFEPNCSHDEITFNKFCLVVAGDIFWDMVFNQYAKMQVTFMVDSERENTLNINYFIHNYSTRFRILIDGILLAEDEINDSLDFGDYITKAYHISKELTDGKDSVNVILETGDNSRGPVICHMYITAD